MNKPPTPDHAPDPAEGEVLSGRVIPAGESWPVRPGLPAAAIPSQAAPPASHTGPVPTSTAPAPLSPPATAAAGGAGDWWAAPPTPPVPPPGGWGGPPWGAGPVPDPWGGPPQSLDIHVHVVPAVPVEEEKPGFWKRVWRLLTRGISPYAAWGALAAAVVPIPGIGYGVGRIWGSVLFQIGQWTNGVIPGLLPDLIGLSVLALAFRALVLRPGAVRFFYFSTAAIGAATGVLWPDVVAFMTGVR